MSIQTKTMTVKSDTSLAETTTTIRDTVTFDVSNMPNGITYKGLKAVLSFADPIQWNKASTYDALTVVWDDASHGSYASKRRVPANIELTNEFYWLRTADLDAQVEMYRAEVQEYKQAVEEYHQEIQTFDGRINANANAISQEKTRAEEKEAYILSNTLNKPNKILLIGDSWVDTRGTYGQDLNTRLKDVINGDVTSIGASGGGWLKQGINNETFVDCVNRALELENKNTYDCVIFIGGINDEQP